MKRIIFTAMTALFVISGTAVAESTAAEVKGAGVERPAGGALVEDKDGTLQAGEYEVVSPNGAVTRGLCPHTCDMRGIPKEHCKEWKSEMYADRCYVHDTRLPSGAVKFE